MSLPDEMNSLPVPTTMPAARSPPTPRSPDPATGAPLYTSETSDQQNLNAGFINSRGENRSYTLSGNRVFLFVLFCFILVLFYFLKLILVSPQFSVIL